MEIWAVDYFTNSWVGNLCGEAARDVDLVHLAYSKEDALKWCVENKDYGNACNGDHEPAWHWRITPWEVGGSDCMTEGEHYTPDGYPCTVEGVEIDPAAYTPGMDDYPCQCEDCDGSCDCECEPQEEEEVERPRGHFLVRHEEGKLPSVDLDEIEQAYEEQAEDKAREEFSSFANKIADRMNQLADLALDICEELRDEFPSR